MFFMFIVIPLFILSLLTSGIVLLVSKKDNRSAVAKTIVLMYAVALGLLILAAIALAIFNKIEAPMNVDRSDVTGMYKVDKDMFGGPNADWQHEHFLMTITEEDTLTLESLDGQGNWHSFKRRIIPVRGIHSDVWRFESEEDSTEHHILANTPTLHRQQWSFYYSFRSPRFGTVFFRKK